MIGVIIANLRLADNGVQVVEVDSWLMSCRVLGRKVEEAMLLVLAERAMGAGATRIEASYIPTAKNQMVRDLFDRLGFTRVGEGSNGVRTYAFELRGWTPKSLPLEMVR